jgi:endo-1,4-beta-xylanase
MNRKTFIKTAAGAAASAAWPHLASSGNANTLREAAKSKDILAGSAVSNPQLHDPQLTEILAEQCGIIVAENEMKWRHIHPEPDRYDFTKADELMEFAATNSMQVRGHNLCWHESVPDWLADNATHANAARLLREHIHTVAGRYAGRIHSWDVVNEALDPDGLRDDGLRDSLWMQLLGPKYIAIAYRAAHEADPKALLTYNEYDLEGGSAYNERRRNVALAFLRWMRENRIPLHALGLQSHFRVHYDQLTDWGGLHAFLKEIRKLELQVFITELDIDDTDLSTKAAKREKQVAEFSSDYLKMVLKHPHVTAVLTWGMVSHELRQNQNGTTSSELRHIALPFNENLQPTPFLSSIVQSFQK